MSETDFNADWIAYEESANRKRGISDKSSFMRVGQGKQTSPKCGTYLRSDGCLNVDLHNLVTLDSYKHTNQVYVKKIFWHCDKPSCPVCFKKGWAVREAMNIESRIKEASKRFGFVEHVVVSVPVVDYELSYVKLRAKIMKVLEARKVFGGVLIYHMERFAKRAEALRKGIPQGWRFSPHFHVLGFIDGGYGCCRGCSNCSKGFRGELRVLDTLTCLRCEDGFEGRTRREYEKEAKGVHGAGYIVKVQGERKTIFGTAWYQLHHSTFRTEGLRSQVATWFGTCSYRRLKLKPLDVVEHDCCPVCGSVLKRVMYVGRDGCNPLDDFWVKDAWCDEKDSDGNLNWAYMPEVKRSYESLC